MDRSIFSRISCGILAVSMAICASACSSSKNVAVPEEGYELPYSYSDGYKANLNTIDNSSYVTTSTDLIGNKITHFTTTHSEEEVKAYYDAYFATLEEVKRSDDSDKSKGYFDEEKRLIMYNLIVWTADGQTNYKLQSEACDKVSDSKNWDEIK